MKKFLLGLVALGLPNLAFAVAIGAHGGAKAHARALDASGFPIVFNQDKPWHVFEVAYSATTTQVLDDKGNAPKEGVVTRVCLESGTGTNWASQWAVIYDASNTVNTGTTGYRLAPALMRASGVVSCTDINAQFTSGLVIQNLDTNGSTYVYWR